MSKKKRTLIGQCPWSTSPCWLLLKKLSWDLLNIKAIFPDVGISNLKIGWSWDVLSLYWEFLYRYNDVFILRWRLGLYSLIGNQIQDYQTHTKCVLSSSLLEKKFDYVFYILYIYITKNNFCVIKTQIAKFMGPTWGPPGSCWPQMGSILA